MWPYIHHRTESWQRVESDISTLYYSVHTKFKRRNLYQRPVAFSGLQASRFYLDYLINFTVLIYLCPDFGGNTETCTCFRSVMVSSNSESRAF